MTTTGGGGVIGLRATGSDTHQLPVRIHVRELRYDRGGDQALARLLFGGFGAGSGGWS